VPEMACLVGGPPCGLQGHPGLAKAALQTKGTPAAVGREVHCLAPLPCPPASQRISCNHVYQMSCFIARLGIASISYSKDDVATN